MQARIIGVLKLFLTFASSFQPHHAQNMLVFMLDPCFKNLQFIKDYVGLELAMQIATNYDRKFIMPLSLTLDHALTPNLAIVTSIAFTMVRLNVFGSLVSIEKSTMGFIGTKL
jgi:hypothetical protein